MFFIALSYTGFIESIPENSLEMLFKWQVYSCLQWVNELIRSRNEGFDRWLELVVWVFGWRVRIRGSACVSNCFLWTKKETANTATCPHTFTRSFTCQHKALFSLKRLFSEVSEFWLYYYILLLLFTGLNPTDAHCITYFLHMNQQVKYLPSNHSETEKIKKSRFILLELLITLCLALSVTRLLKKRLMGVFCSRWLTSFFLLCGLSHTSMCQSI